MQTRVLLLVESSRSIGRGLLRGIAGYVRAHRTWSVLYQERTLGDEAPSWLRGCKADGIIARLENPRLVQAVRRLKAPVVDLRGRHRLPGMVTITSNQQSVARLAAEHLLERGFRRFAFCGFKDVDYSELRLNCFRQYLAERGYKVQTFATPHNLEALDTSSRESEALLHQDALADWLRTLPKPAALLACNDICGQQVLNACQRDGILVPDELAVIGVDNDLILCELSSPPLTSVVLDTYRIGFEAAAVLARMIQGEQPESSSIRIEPRGVEVRQSTDVVCVEEDSRVAAALRFIRLKACSGICVDDVAQGVATSRRTLERRFTQLTGKSIQDEITRVRLSRIKQLLTETSYALSDIAGLTGFDHPEYMNVLFKRETHQTPGEYRRFATTTLARHQE